MESDKWVKSSYSNGTGGSNCVEVLHEPDSDVVIVRHSKHPDGIRIPYTREEWDAFCVGVRNGEFDING